MMTECDEMGQSEFDITWRNVVSIERNIEKNMIESLCLTSLHVNPIYRH